MPEEHAWLTDYINALPTNLRPQPSHPRFLRAAATAYRNGWTPQQAADSITARNYHHADNPPAIATLNLEELATTTPPTPPDSRPHHTHHNDAHCRRTSCPCTHTPPCYKGWLDQELTSQQHQWTAPCPTCRPTTHEWLRTQPPLGRRVT
jgi:hypothetical protein